MRVELKSQVPGAAAELWELLTSARGAARWLGTDGRDALLVGTPLRLPQRTGDRGTVAAVDAVARQIGVGFACGRSAAVVLHATGVATSELWVSEDSVPAELETVVRTGWNVALAAAWLTWSETVDAREPRQAVVLIHGIGEQLPGATSRAITDALFGANQYYSKPDRVSGSYELRRLQVRRDTAADRPRTDVFELYWGHQIRDTTRAQVTAWLWETVRRPLRRVSAGMRGIWLVTRILAALLVLTLILLVVTIGTAGLAALWSSVTTFAALWYVSLGLTLVVGVVTGWYVQVLGDAARYLSSHPGNVVARTAVRDAGIELLRRLHADRRYHRVVVAGHSVGSVIGYDVLRHYWSEVSERHGRPVKPDNAPVRAYAKGAPAAAGAGHQDLQSDLWEGLRHNGVPWLVTDFVTLGSPLAHAGTLLAESPDDLLHLQTSRVMATCPPQLDAETNTYSYPQRYLSVHGAPSIDVLHHAALFGPTRWTNLHSPVRGAFFGDFVGGKVAPAFGEGVVDREVEHSSRLVKWTVRAHTAYWREDGKAGDRGALKQLKAALRIDMHARLTALAAQRPLSDFLPADPPEDAADREPGGAIP